MAAHKDVAPGEIRAAGLGRHFALAVDGPRTLKETLLRRQVRKREFWALRDVDLHIASNESVGVVGRNGSGKSTLLKLMARIFAPSEGTLEIGGRVGPLLDVGAGFHPDFTGIENVYLSGVIQGLSRKYIDRNLDEIIAFAELERFANMPVRTYSSGMFLRLGFSVAIHIRPDILLVDEVLAVGDEGFQQKCLVEIDKYRKSGGTLVFVSHDLASVERICDRSVLVDGGRVLEVGPTESVLRAYHRVLAHDDQLGGIGCRIQEVRARDSGGVIRDRFAAGEPVMLEIELGTNRDWDGLAITLSIRESNGRAVGSQTATDVSFEAGTQLVRLHLPTLPMREGYFRVDAFVADADGRVLAKKDDALELSVSSDDLTSHGPIQLGGTWEVPTDQIPPANLRQSPGDLSDLPGNRSV